MTKHTHIQVDASSTSTPISAMQPNHSGWLPQQEQEDPDRSLFPANDWLRSPSPSSPSQPPSPPPINPSVGHSFGLMAIGPTTSPLLQRLPLANNIAQRQEEQQTEEDKEEEPIQTKAISPSLVPSLQRQMNTEGEEKQEEEVVQAKALSEQGVTDFVQHYRQRVTQTQVSRPPGVPILQRKLVIGQPNDKYEQEADRVADQVMRMPEPELLINPIYSANSAQIQRLCPTCEEEVQRQAQTSEPEDTEGPITLQAQSLLSPMQPVAPYRWTVQRQFTDSLAAEANDETDLNAVIQPKSLISPLRTLSLQRRCTECSDIQQQALSGEEETSVLQTKSDVGQSSDSPSNLASQIHSQKAGGQPLPDSTRTFFETRLDRDLSSVRVHTGAEAAQLSRTVHAYAFTHGNHIWLGEGSNTAPSELMAHELVHVIQQTQPPTLQRKTHSAAPTTVPQPSSSSPIVQRRFMNYYWEPAEYRDRQGRFRRRGGTRTHNELLPQISSQGGGIFIEAPVPNANRGGSGGEDIIGAADLYRASTTVGVYFVGDRPRRLAAPRGLRFNGATYAHQQQSAPWVNAAQQVARIDQAPQTITLGDLKPTGSIQARDGQEQLAAYEQGFQYAKQEVNRLAAQPNSPTAGQRWDSLSVSRFSQAALQNLIPATYRYPATSQPSQTVVLKENGRIVEDRRRPVGQRRTQARGRLILHPDPENRGVLNYVWIPESIATQALPQGIRQMGTDVVRDILNPLRDSPLQQQIARKAKPGIIPVLRQPVVPIRRIAPQLIQRQARDRFNLQEWRTNQNRLRDRFRQIRGSQDYSDAETAAQMVEAHRDLQANVPFSLPEPPQQTRNTASEFRKIEFWTSRPATAFGYFRRVFGQTFVRIVNSYERMRDRLRERFRNRLRPGSGGGLIGAAVKAVFSVVKMAGQVVIQQTLRVLQESLRRGVEQKLRTFLEGEGLAELEAKLAEIQRLRQALEQQALERAQNLINSIIQPYMDVINQIEQVRQTVETATTIINLVRWGARAIACVSPPAVGCLWALAQGVLEQAAALVVQTCWFQTKIKPWTLRLEFVRSLPTRLATLIIQETRNILPSSLHDIFADPEVAPPSPDEVECDTSEGGGTAPTAEQQGVYELQERLGEERFEAFLELSRRAGLPASTPLTSERAREIAQIIEQSGATAEDLRRYAEQYPQNPAGVPVDLRTFLQNTQQRGTQEEANQGQQIAERLRNFSTMRTGQISITGFEGELQVNQRLTGFLAHRNETGTLVGGTVQFIPLRQVSRRRWRVRIEPGWQLFNEQGQFMRTVLDPIQFNNMQQSGGNPT